MELENNCNLLVFTIFSITLLGTAQAACVPKKQILIEILPASTSPASSKPQSPPQPSHPPPSPPSSPRPSPPSSPPPSLASSPRPSPPSSPPPSPPPSPPSASSKTNEPTPPAGLPNMDALKNATNQSLDSLKKATNPGPDAVKCATNPEISKICDQADYKDLCCATIAPFFTGKTDIYSVMDMMIKGCEAGATQAKAEATKLKAQANPSDKSSISGFNSCLGNFDDALDYLQQALNAMRVKDISTTQTQLSAAISLTSTCDDNFSGEPDPSASTDNPMEKTDENLINMIGNALAVLDKNKALI